mmetsp:Transcript_30047/g.87907  ORF Transcript_30047/g.87907 Transcript_30047/m.87907 type:complete len:205 (-) Transcript_30047:22-636(-)
MEELEAVEGGEGLRVRLRAGKQLPEDDSVREDVDGGRVLDATRGGGGEHLGRHVLDRADERGHLGGVRRPAREAKVGDLDGDAAAVRVEAEKDVGGREVAVDDAVVVKVLQPLGDLQREREHRLLRQSVGVAPPEQLLQRQVAQLGHNVEVALVVAAAEEVQHVRVAQPREQRRLRAAVRHHRRRGDLLDCDQLARVHAAVHAR